MAATDDMLCFSLYAASRATTQVYRTLLEPWGLTYPQYLVLVVLWRDGEQTVTSLGEALHLDSGTLSPLLRRMSDAGLVSRTRNGADERVVTISLAPRGVELRAELGCVPSRIAEATGVGDVDVARELIRSLNDLTRALDASRVGGDAAGSRAS